MKNKSLDLVIELLKNREAEIINELKNNPENSASLITLKSQIKESLRALGFWEEQKLAGYKVEVIEISEEGSEGHFTDYKIVDEAGMDKVPDWAIKKDQGKEIDLNWGDLIIQRTLY